MSEVATVPKYRAGDRLLAFVTVEASAHSDSVHVVTDSRQKAQLKESDIHSVVLSRFKVGDRVRWREENGEHAGAIQAVSYDISPPQAWVKDDAEWPMKTVQIKNLQRLIY